MEKLNLSDVLWKEIVINNISYLIVEANNGMPEAVSLYNMQTNKYLRHFCSKLIESDVSLNAKYFPDDSSFIPKLNNAQYCFYASNKALRDFYIANDDAWVISNSLTKEFFSIRENQSLLLKELIKSNISLKKEIENKIEHLNEIISLEKIRNVSGRLEKDNLVAFIGTGRLGENVVYACLAFKKYLDGHHSNTRLVYIAGNNTEREFIEKYNIPCIVWNAKDPEHIEIALKAKVSLFSTHCLYTFNNEMLLSCLSGSYKIQLWHGFLAKMVGWNVIKKGNDIKTIADMLDDTAVNVVTSALMSEDVEKKYKICFPNARVVCTGDARTDVLFENHKTCIDKYVNTNKSKIRILFCPTYRESTKMAEEYINELIKFSENISQRDFSLAIKFHPVFFNFLKGKEKEIHKKLESSGYYIIDPKEDSYKIMSKFDVMLTDYSSIRFDFMITQKPIFLFRPDYKAYTAVRTINPLKEFDYIDSVLYEFSYNISSDDLATLINEDPKKSDRIRTMNEMGLYTDGKNSERVVKLILEYLM